MNGVEVRIVQVHSRDTDLGTEGADSENAGAIELIKDGVRVAELVWWESERTDIETLLPITELNGHLTYITEAGGGFASLPITQVRR